MCRVRNDFTLLILDTVSLLERFSKFGPWDSSISITWEFTRNIHFSALPPFLLNQKPWG